MPKAATPGPRITMGCGVCRAALCLLLSAFLALLLAGPSHAQPAHPLSLVRINVRAPNDLMCVDAAEVRTFAYLLCPTGEYLLVVLSSEEWDRLTARGLSMQVLDADATGRRYALADSGHPKLNVASGFTIVHDDGRRVVLRLAAGTDPAEIERADLPLLPLGPDPITLVSRASGLPTPTTLYDSLVVSLLTQVTTSTLSFYVGELSGEWPAVIGGQPYRITTRYTYSGEPLAKATQYVYERLQARGYAASYHNYLLGATPLRNVVGEKRGRAHPNQILLLTAHLDSRAFSPPHDPAPGADDNASGSAALLAMADILANLDLDYTIRFVFFTGEEQGMWGSSYYVRDVFNAGEQILGVLNLDMIAWDDEKTSGPDIDLHTNLPGVANDSDVMAHLFADLVGVYGLNLRPQIVENGMRLSDHARFWDKDYAAILAIEDYYNPNEVYAPPNDFNPEYHKTSDRLSTLNLAYFRDFTQASLATFIHLAGPMRTLGGRVTDVASSAPLSATVGAVGTGGIFSTTTGTEGTYALLVSSGHYTVTVSAPGHVTQALADLPILTGVGLVRDFALNPIEASVWLHVPLVLSGDRARALMRARGFMSQRMKRIRAD